MSRSINPFLGALTLLALSLASAQAQSLDALPKPAVSQPKFALQAAEQARTHWRAGRKTQALATINDALRIEPQDLTLRFMRGSLLFETEQFEASAVQFTELAEQFPELAEVHNNLASLHAQAGKLDLARTSLERAIQAQPAYALAWENLASVLARQSLQSLERAKEHANPTDRGRIEIKLQTAKSLSDRILKP